MRYIDLPPPLPIPGLHYGNYVPIDTLFPVTCMPTGEQMNGHILIVTLM